jgi:acetolactate synthase-1/2/3 large subunit
MILQKNAQFDEMNSAIKNVSIRLQSKPTLNLEKVAAAELINTLKAIYHIWSGVILSEAEAELKALVEKSEFQLLGPFRTFSNANRSSIKCRNLGMHGNMVLMF